jgi:hypothetical protein
MRKTFLRAVVALALFAGVAVAANPLQAGAEQDLIPGVVDVSATIESLPEVVSPAGTDFLLRSTLTNESVVPLLSTTAQLKITVAPGLAIDYSAARPGYPVPPTGCNAVGNEVTCTATLGSGQSKVVELPILTEVFTGDPRSYTSTAEAISQDPLEVLEYGPNNNDSVLTTVLAANPNVISGLIKGGQSRTLNVGDGRTYTISVPTSLAGVIVDEIAPRSPLAFQRCGSLTTQCGNGFIVKYIAHPVFQTLNPNNPVISFVIFSGGDPCFGIGGPCTGITWAASETAALLQNMAYCPGAGPGGNRGDGTATGPGNKCINQKRLVNTPQGLVTQFETRSLTEDPIELPPLGLGK